MPTFPDFLRLMIISDGSAACGVDERKRLLARLEQSLEGGATALMVRERGLSSRELGEFALQAREHTRRHGAWLIVNDRVDIALAVEADAVHLGWQSLDIERVRGVVGDRLRIGYSTHSIEQALASQERGADYVTFGPVFFTPSKANLVPVQGLTGFAGFARAGCAFPALDWEASPRKPSRRCASRAPQGGGYPRRSRRTQSGTSLPGFAGLDGARAFYSRGST
jgi:thiamine-phosphate diphosphorylase